MDFSFIEQIVRGLNFYKKDNEKYIVVNKETLASETYKCFKNVEATLYSKKGKDTQQIFSIKEIIKTINGETPKKDIDAFNNLFCKSLFEMLCQK